MTRFHVNMCLEPTAAGDLDAALTAAMAPFDHNLTGDWSYPRDQAVAEGAIADSRANAAAGFISRSIRSCVIGDEDAGASASRYGGTS